MFMVVTLHVLGHGGILDAAKSAHYWGAWFLEIAAYCSVNCYALISGYVGVYSRYKFSNLVILWCRVAFYTVTITLIFKCLFPDSIGKGTLLFSFIPILSKQYWYFTSYALMFLFVPIMNEGINRLSKRQMGFLLLTIVSATSLAQPLCSKFFNDVFVLNEGYSAWWLMIFYLIGGYIRKYGLFQRIRSYRSIIFFLLYLAAVAVTWLSMFGIKLVSTKIWGEPKAADLLVSYQSITIVASAVFLLLCFEKLQFCSVLVRIIAFLSPLAFSVYLIHLHPQILNRFISGKFVWVAGLPVYEMIPVILGIVLVIYLLCSAIDLIRHYLFKAVRLKERLEKSENRLRGKFLSRKHD